MKYKLITPNINLQAKNPKMAYVARAVSLIGAAIVIVLQLFEFNLIPLLLGTIPLIVEFDFFTLFMKKPLFRGIAYGILGFVLLGFTPIYAGGVILLGGILYAVYDFM